MISRQGKEYQQGQFMNVEGHVFKRLTHFKYLGHLLTQNNGFKMDINTRIQKGNKWCFGLRKIQRILRKIYGPGVNTHTREWQKRHNHELEKPFQKLNIANEILKRKLT